ncbi:O-acetyltransferase OatA [compost metagenome]
MKYSPELDGLRAIAAALVVAAHAGVPGMSPGFLGVDTFFVLSGYLITRLLTETHQQNGFINYKAFFIRRLRRLYPPLLALLAVYLACAPFYWPQIRMERHLQDALVAAFYMADYAKTFGEPIKILNHVWSLGVEEKYYLLWPLVLPLIMRLPKHQGIALLAIMFAADTLWRIHLVTTLDKYWLVYNRFDTHASGLLLGSLLGYANVRISAKWAWAGAALMAWVLYANKWAAFRSAMFGFTEMEIAAAILVCSRPGVLAAGILPWLGKMSYGVYLWSFFFLRIGWYYGIDGWIESLAFSGSLSLAAAALSYYTIESFFRRHKPLSPTAPQAA